MPDLDTKAIEAELAAAPKGPWTIHDQRVIAAETFHCNGRQRNSMGISSASYSEVVCHTHNWLELDGPRGAFEFIAHAPTHVRNLIARVKELEAHVLQTNGLLLLAALHKEDVDGEHYLDAETKEECRVASVHGQGLLGAPV